MKKIILFLLLLMVACAPSAPTVKDTDTSAPSEPQVVAKEQVESPPVQEPPKTAVKAPEVAGTPLEPTGSVAEPYSRLGCESLLSAEEFASECNKTADNLVVTYRIGTRNCIVNIKDRENDRLTAGIALTGYSDAGTAKIEFDRRLVVMKVGADDSVGERAYVPPAKLIDREALEFLRGKFIVEAGTDTRLCSKEGLIAVSKIVDSRLK